MKKVRRSQSKEKMGTTECEMGKERSIVYMHVYLFHIIVFVLTWHHSGSVGRLSFQWCSLHGALMFKLVRTLRMVTSLSCMRSSIRMIPNRRSKASEARSSALALAVLIALIDGKVVGVDP
mmetsp:Transcript_2456/g.3314  ORF Transcript_2456/g.3314 Transcript_2456/m.3314 type:complete len:121 (+) Transcript_2456:67-429(+)